MIAAIKTDSGRRMETALGGSLSSRRTTAVIATAERARAEGYPWDVARRMAELGLMGIALAEDDGGSGGTLVDSILAIQAVAEVCPRSGDVIQAGNFGPVRTFAEYGTPEQKERFLGPILAGHAVISLGMTEPQAGSAVTELSTSAPPDRDGFLINGTKILAPTVQRPMCFWSMSGLGRGSMALARC